MIERFLHRPACLKVQVDGDDIIRNVLSQNPDYVEESTLALEMRDLNSVAQCWVFEKSEDEKTYFIRAYGKQGKGYCLTAISPDFTWQALSLEPFDKNRKEQRWRIHRNNKGYYRFNNLRYMDKYLAKVPGVRFDMEQDIAMISPPLEIIGIGYVLLNWSIELVGE